MIFCKIKDHTTGNKVWAMLPTSADAIRGETSRNKSAGSSNPHYILFEDYYGVVYATYVGPNVDFIDYSIWFPKTLVANVRGPMR